MKTDLLASQAFNPVACAASGPGKTSVRLAKSHRLMGAALVLFGFAGSALAVTDINSCQTIVEPGSYRVMQNLTPVGTGGCLDIRTSDVTIDLQGHVITGNGGTSSAGVSVPNAFLGGNIVVRNGTIRFFRDGVRFAGHINGLRIENLQVHNNPGFGIFVASNAIVSGNMARNNGTGIIVRPPFGLAGDGSLITDNTAIDNVSGINVEVAGSTASGNVVQRNTGDGIRLTCPINFRGNTSTANNVNLRLLGSGCLSLDNLVGP